MIFKEVSEHLLLNMAPHSVFIKPNNNVKKTTLLTTESLDNAIQEFLLA